MCNTLYIFKVCNQINFDGQDKQQDCYPQSFLLCNLHSFVPPRCKSWDTYIYLYLNLYYLYVSVKLVQHHLFNILPLCYEMPLTLCLKLVYIYVCIYFWCFYTVLIVCLLLCCYYTILITVTFRISLKTKWCLLSKFVLFQNDWHFRSFAFLYEI